jgi:hypothetical protein
MVQAAAPASAEWLAGGQRSVIMIAITAKSRETARANQWHCFLIFILYMSARSVASLVVYR